MSTKTSMKLAVAMFAALAALVMSSGLASAYYGGDLQVTQQVSQVCPCRILSASEVAVKLTNFGTKSDTFYLTISVPPGWGGFIVPEVALASGEAVILDPAWISPPCGTLPGKYSVKLRAESAMSGKADEEVIELTVMQCHAAAIDAEGFSVCEGGNASSQAFIENAGNLKETFFVSASPSWVSVSPATATVDELGTVALAIKASPPAGTYGRFNATIRAQSKVTYAWAERNITVDVVRCTYFSASMLPPEESFCLGEKSSYYLNIDNKGTKDDRYMITAPSWVSVSQQNVSVSAGSRKTVKLSVSPVSAGQKKLTIYVSSLNYPTEIVPVEAMASAKDCRAASIAIEPEKLGVCRGAPSSFTAKLTNTGNMQTAYAVRFFVGGTQSREDVMLSPGESQEISIDVDSSAAGEYPVLAEVLIGNRTAASASSALSVARCYDAVLSVPAAAGGICIGDTVEVEVSVKNTGTKKDVFNLTHPGGSEKFSLSPGESADIVAGIDIDGSYDWGSETNVTFSLRSDGGVRAQRQVAMRVDAKGKCYSAQVSVAGTGIVNVPRGNGTSFAVTVNNTGSRPDSYALSLGGPEWAYLTAEEIKLSPGKVGTAYVYLSPPYDAQEGNYTLTVLAESDEAMGRLVLKAVVADSFPDSGDGAASQAGGGLTGMFLFSAMTIEAGVLIAMVLLTAIIVLLRFVIFK